LESFAIGTRLTRGRNYARAGQVISLDVAPGAVSGLVQGSRATPYRATIGLTPFAEPVWAAIEETLAGQAIYSARLLAGDLPPDLEQVFADQGAPLFPRNLGELTMSCSCPDFAVPCKHLAASFYLLAEAFDADPFQLLHWRGRPREALLAHLRGLRGGALETGSLAAPPPAPPAPIGTGPVLVDVPDIPLGDSVDRFWLAPAPLPPRPPTIQTEADLLLRQLPTPGRDIGGPGLLERLRPAYDTFAES
jgi:hypothetical protein